MNSDRNVTVPEAILPHGESLQIKGLSARPVGNSDEIQLRIDPVHADLDEEISGLHKQVTQLKHVAQEIETEARILNEFVSDLVTNANEQSSGRSKKWDDKVESNCCSAEIESHFASDNLRSHMFLHRLLMVKALQEMTTLAPRLPCHCECI
ncbi:hypothetical protein CXB51_028302 [Gossypium anomalum]|uniref:t-SNARE coiled-coil homology domain-containing protein n=1 Tax=Gossypium anomalum TaxID=47600 RepID=A0A8J5YIK4_9ROSI|nr:hypothetical protein CXB51_028302 [Gossypium anomalum]